MIIQIIDCVRTDRTSDDESREALRYLEGIWQNRLATMTANGNINHLDEMTSRGNRIPTTIRNLLNMQNVLGRGGPQGRVKTPSLWSGGRLYSCDKCRRECLNRKHMMNHMENESDQVFIHYEGQQPPLFWGLKIFILVRKPGLPYGSVWLLPQSPKSL